MRAKCNGNVPTHTLNNLGKSGHFHTAEKERTPRLVAKSQSKKHELGYVHHLKFCGKGFPQKFEARAFLLLTHAFWEETERNVAHYCIADESLSHRSGIAI